MTIAVIEITPMPTTTIEVLSAAPVIVDVAEVGIAGPPGPAGPAGATGPQGPPGDPAELPADTVIANSVAVGTNPATTGDIRLNNDSTLSFRNPTNTGDIPVFRFDTAEQLIVQAVVRCLFGTHLWPAPDATHMLGHPVYRWLEAHVANSVSVGTNPAQSGAVRLANDQSIKWRNATNTADHAAITFDVNDSLIIGAGIQNTMIDAASQLILAVAGAGKWFINSFAGWGNGGLIPSTHNASDIGVAGQAVRNAYLGTSLSVGDNPAQSGAVRLANGASITARNNTNTADVSLIHPFTDGNLYIGNDGINLILRGPVSITADFSVKAIHLVENTFANLPAAAIGMLANVSDSNTATIGGTIAGGGTNHVLARYNGTAWKVVA